MAYRPTQVFSTSVRKLLLLICMLSVIPFAQGLEASLTINVPAGFMECMHQYLEKGVHYEVEYQVIDGGDLDINFLISTPSQYQHPFITDFRRTGNVHKNIASETGDYRFCIDNAFSHFSQKLVFFELYTNDGKDDDEIDKMFGSSSDTEEYEIKLEDFKASLDRIKDNLQKSSHTQRIFSAIESRDRSILENNFELVNLMSIGQVIIMICAGLANIIVIHFLFKSPQVATKQRT